jgi:hypothetical protein
MTRLNWQPAKPPDTVPGSPCFEAKIDSGKYRVAAWMHVDRKIGYEAFFIPDDAQSMADVRDIAGSAEQGSRGLLNIDDARAAAERDFAAVQGDGPAELMR